VLFIQALTFTQKKLDKFKKRQFLATWVWQIVANAYLPNNFSSSQECQGLSGVRPADILCL
jgi:hypothetical protein